ncbi:MAG: hypothetical protein J7L71_10590, partial [Spirochaetaceae bacterium]|nr:hypothetical protein [Spirochaetaceae bacterium]
NLFAAFDRIEIPTVTDLNAKASSNPDGFVSDVSDYVDNNFLDNPDVTTVQVDAIVANLENIYAAEGATETGQQAAVLAGGIIINSDPDTAAVVNGVVGAVTSALESGSASSEDIVAEVFPTNMTLGDFTDILNNLDLAAAAYSDFASTIDSNGDGVLDGNADWMTSGEAGDMVQFAIVAIIIDDIRDTIYAANSNDQAAADLELFNFINDPLGSPLSHYDEASENPLDNSELTALLAFAGLDL